MDDCIAAVLGGTDGYLRLLKRYPGVFYLTPGWAENWRTLMNKMEITRGIDGDDLATLKWMFELAGYKLALKILGKAEGETVFGETRFPTFPGYTGNPWFVPLAMRWYDWKDARFARQAG